MTEFTEHGSSAFGFPNAFPRLTENNRDIEETPLIASIDNMYEKIAERDAVITDYIVNEDGSSSKEILAAHTDMLDAAWQSMEVFFELHKSRSERIEFVAGLFYITQAAEAKTIAWLVDYAPTHGEFVPLPFQRILSEKYRQARRNNTKRRQVLAEYYQATFLINDILTAAHHTRAEVSNHMTEVS